MSEESYFRSLYEHIDVPILVIDVDVAGEFIFGSLNPACEKATGFRREEMVGKRPEAISGLSPAGASTLRANCRRCLETNDIIRCRGILEEGVHFIQKPFSIKNLAAQSARSARSKIDRRRFMNRFHTIVPLSHYEHRSYYVEGFF